MTTFIGIPVGVSNYFGLGTKFKTIEHYAAGFSHSGLGFMYNIFNFINPALNQKGVMDWCTYPDSALRSQATG